MQFAAVLILSPDQQIVARQQGHVAAPATLLPRRVRSCPAVRLTLSPLSSLPWDVCRDTLSSVRVVVLDSQPLLPVTLWRSFSVWLFSPAARVRSLPAPRFSAAPEEEGATGAEVVSGAQRDVAFAGHLAAGAAALALAEGVVGIPHQIILPGGGDVVEADIAPGDQLHLAAFAAGDHRRR